MSTTTTSADGILQAALAAMNAKYDGSSKSMFDVTIICTTDDHQATYWMDRLSTGVCKKTTTNGNADAASSHYPMVLAVSEDWNAGGGAGNGLGTLYAFEKACQLASQLTNGAVNLRDALARGEISASLYHTAGKGTRLAPMPAGENNNKPGVKLPFPLATTSSCGKTTYQPMTVLESVVKQTGIYAASRKGRLSVFWGDQVFLPTAPFSNKPTHHIDIMCTLLGDTAPTAEEWKAQGLEKYGVIACMETKEGKMEAAQVEKVSHETATNMLSSLGGSIRQVGPSLGSFSVSSPMLECLTQEFAAELKAKTDKLDTDPHFWMPLTLSKQDYTNLMKQKGTDEAESEAHHDRMAKLKESFFQQQGAGGDSALGLFGAVDVGKDACWWDYGQLKLYSKNSLLLLEDGQSANLLRQFLGLEAGQKVLECTFPTDNAVAVDHASYALDVKANSGKIEKSLLAAVRATEIQANGAIVVNCAAKKITAGPGAILYNILVSDDHEIVAEAGQVMVGVMDQDGKDFILQSRMDIDGGDAWKKKLDMNELSFEDVNEKNKGANIVEIQKKRAAKFESIASSLGF